MNTQDITQEQITEARDWASDCLGMVAETVTINRALKYITANYPGGWDAFVAEVCVDALVPASFTTSGYTSCACRDCMDVTVSSDMAQPELCSECKDAGCVAIAPYNEGIQFCTSYECQRDDAYSQA